MLATHKVIGGVGADAVLTGSADDRFPSPVPCINPVVPRAGVIGVTTAATLEPIGAPAAGQPVITISPQQAVAIRIADKAIVSAPPTFEIGASKAQDQIASRAAVEDIWAPSAAELALAAAGP